MEKVQLFLSKLTPDGARQVAVELLEFRSSGILKSTGIVRELEAVVAESVGVGINNLSITLDAASNEIISRYLEMAREKLAEGNSAPSNSINQDQTGGEAP
jgi:hypothetical protein